MSQLSLKKLALTLVSRGKDLCLTHSSTTTSSLHVLCRSLYFVTGLPQALLSERPEVKLLHVWCTSASCGQNEY